MYMFSFFNLSFYALSISSRWAVDRPSSCPLSIRSFSVCDAISLYLVEWSQWNLAQIFTILVGIAEKVFRVRGQRSRSQRGRAYFTHDLMSLYLVGDFNETCQKKYSLCEWELLKSFLGVRVQRSGHGEAKCASPAER